MSRKHDPIAFPDCDYCGRPARLLSFGDEGYPYRRPYGRVWICPPCDAYVGVHENSRRFVPLGRLANKTLRAAKQFAHAHFDPLWMGKMQRDLVSKGHARKKAYAWLAQQLGIEITECHIGMFDETMCQRVVDVCKPYLNPNRKIR